MANEVLRKVGNQICFRNPADFSPAAANDLRQAATEYDLNIANLADTIARASAKIDLGDKRAPAYSVMAAIETATAPTAGEVIEFYWAESTDNQYGNIGGLTGTSGTYAGYSADLSAGVAQMVMIGVMPMAAQGNTVQIAKIGVFSPSERFGQLVVKNESGQTICTDTVESHVVFNPVIDEVQ